METKIHKYSNQASAMMSGTRGTSMHLAGPHGLVSPTSCSAAYGVGTVYSLLFTVSVTTFSTVPMARPITPPTARPSFLA